jgi:hypothetical protein
LGGQLDRILDREAALVVGPDRPDLAEVGRRVVASGDFGLLDQARSDVALALEVVDEALRQPRNLGEDLG